MKQTKLKDVLLGVFIITLVFYGATSFCEWDCNPKNWGGSSRFLFSVLSVGASFMFVVTTID